MMAVDAKKQALFIYQKAMAEHCKPIFKAIKEAADKGEFCLEYPFDESVNVKEYLQNAFNYVVFIYPRTRNKQKRYYIRWDEFHSQSQ
jgi:hypothetical protein